MVSKQLKGIALGLAIAATAATPSLAQRGDMGAARTQALHQCNATANKFTQHTWGDWQLDEYRACMSRHGQQE